MTLQWSELFGLSVPPLELVVRGSARYLFLLVLFRVVIKRRMGAIGEGLSRARRSITVIKK
jgi:hypothetical protein